MTETTRTIVDDAIAKWEDLTGLSRDRKTFSLGSLDLRDMSETLAEMLKRDPEGTTSYMLLEVFLRHYLEGKSFTAAQIMRDYDATTAFLGKAEALFSILQSERATEIAAAFRARVLEGLRRYGADRPDVIEVLDDADTMALLRRDALRSRDSLEAFQFLSGERDARHPQVVSHVHIAWSIDDLLLSVRDMPVSGIALVLLRDASHPDRSYFTFAMRNGDNVFLFTDKSRPAYPGQEDVLAARGGRGIGRDFDARTTKAHFPYQIIPTSRDEKGDLHFDRENAPVASGLSLAPLMAIADLPPVQAIWTTMMLSLVAEKFWHRSWQAEELSYTGSMVAEKRILVEEDGISLPAAAGYREIAFDRVHLPDVTAEAMTDQLAKAPLGVNAWLEARYRDKVPEEILNVSEVDQSRTMFLPLPKGVDDIPFWDRDRIEGGPGSNIMTFRNDRRSSAPGYPLIGVAKGDFGTENEIRKDRLFVARHNMAQAIQKAADEEFEARKDEVLDWYRDAVEKNMHAIHGMIASGEEAMIASMPDDQNMGSESRNVRHKIMWISTVGKQDRYEGSFYARTIFGGRTRGSSKVKCAETGALATYDVTLRPRNAEHLGMMTGLETKDMPDVLQNWRREKPYVGNHLLRRIDPMDAILDDPWMKANFNVKIYLSKRAMTAIRKTHAGSLDTEGATR